ncbi:MAG: hypothetical protein K0R75_1677 [Paenibacillaceae bacterium]|nr:hypothetical protein [Paenibacillaceae bacterium]
MWMEPFDQAATVLYALSLTSAGGFAALFLLRARRGDADERTRQSLEKHQDYFAYLSANIDGAEPLLPPPGQLSPIELKAIQSKLLEWIETIGGEYRGRLTALCRELGLVEQERKRLRSPKHAVRIEAAYRLGIMRAEQCTDELLQLLEQEGGESTAFVVGRSAAKCAETLDQLRRLLLHLIEYHPDAQQLIADIIASSSLDPAPLYIELLRMEDRETPVCVALIGLTGRNDPDAFGPLNRFISSECKEIRIKAAKALLQYSHMLPMERLGDLIRHSDWEIRAVAIKAIGEWQLDFDIEALNEGMADEEWWVRHYSAASLAQLGPAGYPDRAFDLSAEGGTR